MVLSCGWCDTAVDAKPDGFLVSCGTHGDGHTAGEGVALFGGVPVYLVHEAGLHRQRMSRELPVDLGQHFDDEGVGNDDALSAQDEGAVVNLPVQYRQDLSLSLPLGAHQVPQGCCASLHETFGGSKEVHRVRLPGFLPSTLIHEGGAVAGPASRTAR